MMRALVIGIGNPLPGSDAFGPAVIDRLRGTRDLPAAVELIDAHTDLLSCLERFVDADHVVLVDAILGAGTGEVVTVDEPTFSGWTTESPGSHELSAVMAVRLFRTLWPSARVRVTLVALDADHVDGEPVPQDLVEKGADRVLRLCGHIQCRAMVNVTVAGDRAVFEVEGADKLWSLRSRLEIPLAHITGADFDPEQVGRWWHGVKVIGTDVPGLFAAGTFYYHRELVFWDVRDPSSAIVVSLDHERYKKLIIQVADPAGVVDRLRQAVRT